MFYKQIIIKTKDVYNLCLVYTYMVL